MSEPHSGEVAVAHAAPDNWKRWLGQTVNGAFPLREHLGGDAHRAVFLTEYDHRPAVIQLISENFPGRARRLESWQLATEISHRNLTRVFQVGLCHLEGEELFYAVMEAVEENLGQILADRPLTPEEAGEMLKPAVDALLYLHKRGLAHAALQPANVGAIGDQLKLSSDNLCRTDEKLGDRGNYDPPEASCSPAGDIWSLGMTLVEVLTQRLPMRDGDSLGDPELPENLPAQLREIARNCLRKDAKRRWTAEKIADHLRPKAHKAAEATVRAEGVVSPASPAVKPPVTVAKQTVIAQSPEPARAKPHLQAQHVARVASPGAWPEKRKSLAPITIALVFVAAFVGTKLITRSPKPAVQSPSATAESSVLNSTTKPVPAPPQESRDVVPAERAQATESPKPAGPLSTPAQSVPATPEQSASVSDSGPGDSAVVHKAMPDVLASALRTIRGTVRVGIKASVDNLGNVTDAVIDSPGPSQYFADAALQAARQWKFEPRESSAGDWLLRFDFTQNGLSASARPPVR